MNNDLIVRDSYLNDEEFNTIQTATSSRANFSWWQHSHHPEKQGLFNHQFTHLLNAEGKWCSDKQGLFEPICNYLEAFLLIRIKVNLLPATPEPVFGGFHVDCSKPEIARSAVLYLDDTNGCTEFETGEKIECVSNRFVEFPAHIKHGSWTCTDRPSRRVVNFNWIPR